MPLRASRNFTMHPPCLVACLVGSTRAPCPPLMNDRPIRISAYTPPKSETASPVTVATSVLELVSSLTGVPEPVSSKSDALAWSPITYSGQARRASEAVAVCALVYDLDEPARVDWRDLEARLEARAWVYAVHETYTPGRARLCVPLARDLAPAEYRGAWEECARELGLWEAIDRACSDLARLFYAPSCPLGETREGGQTGGTVLYNPRESLHLHAPTYPTLGRPDPTPVGRTDPTPLREGAEGIFPVKNSSEKFFDLEKLRREIFESGSAHKENLLALIDGTLRLPPGTRETTLHPTISALAYMRHAPPEGVAVELFRRVLQVREGADVHLEAWVQKALSSYRRGAERKAEQDAKDAAVEKFFRDENWKQSLKFATDSKGAVKGLKPLEANVLAVLRNDPAWAGHVRWNMLRQKIEVTGGILNDLHSNARESLDVPACAWFQTSGYNCDVSRELVGACMQHVALENPYDPVKEYLDNLPRWDGVKRIDEALTRYAEAAGDQVWNRIISRKFFISAVARPLRPGCQVDTVLVLQGSQGGGKTSFVRTLGAGFHVETSLDLHSKDAVMTAVANWLVELGELASLRKSDIESTRNFITRKEDQIRLPYGRSIKSMPRRCVFIGTTNSRQPLADPEGNRRFWVVSVGRVNIDALERDREQLWAEAKEAFLSGEPWWLDMAQARRAEKEAALYETDDVLKSEITSWLMNLTEWPEFINANQVCAKVLGKHPTLMSPQESTNINRVFHRLGWQRSRRRVKGVPVWGFVVPPKKLVEERLAADYGMDNVTTESEAA